jgi:hypothetical protein
VKLVDFVAGSCLLDFGKKDNNSWKTTDNVILGLSNYMSYPFLTIVNFNESVTIESTTALGLNKWYHLAGVYDGEYARIFVNSKETGSRQIGKNARPRKIIRNFCYIGLSSEFDFLSWQYPMANAYIDEIRIYNVALNQAQIVHINSRVIESK